MAGSETHTALPSLGRLGLRPRTMMKFIDIHTHRRDTSDAAIIDSPHYQADIPHCSIGIHPCNITAHWRNLFDEIARHAYKKNVVAIGECGFHFTKTTEPATWQQEAFLAHVELSEATQKPLIIHLVKAQERLIAISKQTRHTQAWIIHGFRGKPEQARQLLSHGFYISYGALFNKESVAATPLDKMFIETDEANTAIEDIYNHISQIKGISTEELCRQMSENARQCKIAFR